MVDAQVVGILSRKGEINKHKNSRLMLPHVSTPLSTTRCLWRGTSPCFGNFALIWSKLVFA